MLKILVISTSDVDKHEQLQTDLTRFTPLGEKNQQFVTPLKGFKDIYSVIQSNLESNIENVKNGIQTDSPIQSLIDKVYKFRIGTLIVEITSPPKKEKGKKFFVNIFRIQYGAKFYYTDTDYSFKPDIPPDES